MKNSILKKVKNKSTVEMVAKEMTKQHIMNRIKDNRGDSKEQNEIAQFIANAIV